MTRLGRRVRRVIAIRGEDYVVAMTPHGLELRAYRTRSPMVLPWGHALLRAEILTADATRAERRERRRSKR